MAKTRKKRYKKYQLHVIGKYLDTPTNATLEVVYFMDTVGEYRLTGPGLPDTTLKGCALQIKKSAIKRKKKFYRMLEPYIEYANNWQHTTTSVIQFPLLFGLLKLRKGKERKFILFQSVDCFYKSKTVQIRAAIIDNLLYLDLVNKLKEENP